MTRVLVTRPTIDDPFCRALAEVGLTPEPAELTRVARGDARTLRRAPDIVAGADWVALTSPTAVRVLDETVRTQGRDLPALLGGVRVAAVGRATQAALEALDVEVDLRPSREQEDAAGLAAVFPPAPADPAVHRVVLPASALASDVLAEGLRAKDWSVQRLALYSTVPAPVSDEARARLTDPWPAALVATSGSNVRALVESLGTPPPGTAVVTLGRPTAAVCRELGLSPVRVAADPSPAAVAGAVLTALGERQPVVDQR